MVTAVQQRVGALPVPPQPIDIEENSTLMKVLSCIPILGNIPTVIQEQSLGLKIAFTDEVPRLIELIKVKNKYKVASIVRELIEIALIVTGIALGVLSIGLGTICAAISAFYVGINISRIIENKKVINILQTTGVMPGLRVS